ncbi:MAG: hypothetical protein AAGA42_02380 [Actinomycetota bacterium]
MAARAWTIPQLAEHYQVDPSGLYRYVREKRLRKAPGFVKSVRISEGERIRFFGPDAPVDGEVA